ncbi:MAG TPA: helix-turn-helix transcriptional regulator, partial [Thermoanaerobaculia bacterium]|nr:helix-turn-helix transcriptional regulator [Thermoanaerobaculia bacterium]
MGDGMTRRQELARLLRALSGKTQEDFAEAIGSHPSLIGLIEIGRADPGDTVLRTMARAAGLDLADARLLLDEHERLARFRRQRLNGEVDLMSALPERLRDHLSAALRRLWTLPRPVPLPCTGDREKAHEQWRLLEAVPATLRQAVTRADKELWNWALCELLCEQSEKAAGRSVEEAAGLAQLAEEIASLVRGPEGFCRRLQGYTAAHRSNVHRVAGELKPARVALERAKALWHSGDDPFGLFDPGRLLDLEASLCRGERRFEQAVS